MEVICFQILLYYSILIIEKLEYFQFRKKKKFCDNKI